MTSLQVYRWTYVTIGREARGFYMKLVNKMLKVKWINWIIIERKSKNGKRRLWNKGIKLEAKKGHHRSLNLRGAPIIHHQRILIQLKWINWVTTGVVLVLEAAFSTKLRILI